MMSLTPETTPQDAQGAFAIISLLTDDNKYKLRLEELQRTVAAAQQLHATSREAERVATEKVAQAEARMAEANALLSHVAQREKDVVQLTTATTARQAELETMIQQTKDAAAAAEVERKRVALEMADTLTRRKAETDAEWERNVKLAAARQTELDVVAAAVKNREDVVYDREVAVKQEADQLAAMRKDLEARLIKLRAMVNG